VFLKKIKDCFDYTVSGFEKSVRLRDGQSGQAFRKTIAKDSRA
jgi:hypothetical protein